MSTRRPRIKALANLGSKRKVAVTKPETKLEGCEKTGSHAKLQKSPSNNNISNSNISSSENLARVENNEESCEKITQDEKITNKSPQVEIDSQVNLDTFKYPKTLELKKPNEIEDHSRIIEDDVIQLDLQKSYQLPPASPSKSRQRIKATPIFGHRRNSLIGSSPNPFLEDEQKRLCDGKGISSPNTHIYGPKWSPAGTGRIRTESGCSTFSDSWSRDLTGKQRKTAYEDHPRLPLSRREFQNKYNGKVPEKSTLKMFDLIYYNPTTNPMENSTQKFIASENLEKDPIDETEEEVESNEDQEVLPVPQLKLGVNGEVMLDEKSLEIETTANKEARKLLSNTSLMFLDENSGHNGFYKRKKRTKDWPPEETIKFYKCLHTIGTDFSLMLSLFPSRSRRDLKLKFKKEERSNLGLVNKALMYPKVFDIEELQKQLEVEEQQYDRQQKWKKIKRNETVKRKAKSSSGNAFSKGARSINDGDLVYLVDDLEVQQNKIKDKANRKVPTDNVVNEVSNNTILSERMPSPVLTDESFEQRTIDVLLNIDNIKKDRSSPNNLCMSPSLVQPTTNSKKSNSNLTTNKPSNVNLEHLMTELNNGGLAIVASEDAKGNIIEEIYSIDHFTNELSDKPIDVPRNIVDVIVKAMASF